MEVGRDAPRGSATMVVGFDDPVSDALMEAISSTPGMSKIKLVTLDIGSIQQRSNVNMVPLRLRMGDV